MIHSKHRVFNSLLISSYTGDWFDDLPHGTGEYQWRAGHKYYGNYQIGVPEGNGVFETSRGDIYQVGSVGTSFRLSTGHTGIEKIQL